MTQTKATQFIALTLGISWLLALVFFLAGGQWNTTSAVAMALLYMFVPLMMVVIVQKVVRKEAVFAPPGCDVQVKPLVPGGLVAATCCCCGHFWGQPAVSLCPLFAGNGGPLGAVATAGDARAAG